MLSRFIVHADLSAYNVLYHRGQALIIDFPQTVEADRHPEAFPLFRRDVDRICGYFARQGVKTDPAALAVSLWRRSMG